MRVDLQEGKYTWIFDGSSHHALRHGEPWRDLCGDKLALAMGTKICEQEAKIEELETWKAETQALAFAAIFEPHTLTGSKMHDLQKIVDEHIVKLRKEWENESKTNA